MTAKEQNFGYMSNLGIIQIPFFQRAYVWEEKHLNKLWEDLINSYNHGYTHFLGSFILKSNTSSSCFLIDGQQRITTFSILLRALGQQLNILDKDAKLQSCLFAQDDEYNRIPRIQHSRLDSPVFCDIMLGNTAYNNKSKIYYCHKFFSEKSEQYEKENGKEKLHEFLKKILADKLFVFVEIDKDEDEQRIFDSINTSGQPLANFDIVKNELFSYFNDNKKAEKYYDKYWIHAFEKDDDTKIFWNKEITSGREKKTRSDIFLHSFAVIEQIFNPDKNTLSQLNEIYKTNIKEKDENSIILFIEKFTEYSKIFRRLPFFEKEEEYKYTDTMKRFLHIIDSLQLSTFIPLALYIELIYQQKKISEKEYNNSLQLLEKYIIRRALLNLDTSGYNKTVYTLIRELSKSNNIYPTLKKNLHDSKSDTDKFPAKQDITLSTFENFNVKLAKVLLFWIELKMRYDQKGHTEKETLQYNFQLEHLMPLSWGKYWKLKTINKTLDEIDQDIKKASQREDLKNMQFTEIIEWLDKIYGNGKEILQEADTRNRKIQELGNYTILTGKLNSSLQNFEWERKLNGDGRKKGIKDYSILALNRELCNKYPQEWTEDTITERTQTLKEIILEIW